MTPGAYIRERRLAAGLTLRGIAASLGISTVEYGKIERGIQAVSHELVEPLAAAIPGLDADVLMRFIPSNRRRWIPGMRDVLSGGRLVEDFGADFAWWADGDVVKVYGTKAAAYDLDDAPTIGAIEHVLLPAAWPEHSIEVRRHPLGHEVFVRAHARGGWGEVAWSSGWVAGHELGKTLVHALEAAAARMAVEPEPVCEDTTS